MRLFKPTYRDKKGRTKEVGKWWLEIRDNRGIIRRFAGFTDRAATEETGKNIQRLISFKSANMPPDAQLVKWLENIPSKLRERFVEIGLLDNSRAAASKPLTELVKEYESFILAKERTKRYARDTRARLECVFKGCGFRFWGDISSAKVMLYLKNFRESGASYRTSNHYLNATKMFCKWIVDSGRASESPLRHLRGLDPKLDKRHERRALSPDELKALLKATAESPVRYGMTGYERYLFYRVAAESGLRADEIRTLKVGSFDFDNMTVTVEGAYSKHRKDDVLPLRPDTAKLLQEFMKKKLPNTKAFGGYYKLLAFRTADMLKGRLRSSRYSLCSR